MRFFKRAPEDDMEVRRVARSVWQGRPAELPDGAWLAKLAQARDVDLATAVYYEALRAHRVHGAFADALEAVSPREASVRSGTIVIVPGLVWEDHPELGSDGALVEGIARRLGIDVLRVPVNGRATLKANAEVIVSFLEQAKVRDAWLVSLSKGAADLGYAMRARAGAFAWDKVAGWINICGSPNGADLAARLTGSEPRKLQARATCLAARIPFAAMLEISTGHPVWKTPLEIPAHVTAVSVVGMPLRWHVSRALFARHRLLSPEGPNDGVVLCANAHVPGGRIYPLWGYDHYFRGPQIIPLLYRLLTWLRDAGSVAQPGAKRAAVRKLEPVFSPKGERT